MGFFGAFLNPWTFLVMALAIIHFIRRRPDTYWIYIILFLGPLGATIYLLVEALPDVGLLRQSFKVFPRRRRIYELEAAVLDNPSAGNYEELADLYMEDGNFAKARACYDKAISSRTDSLDPFYRRGVCEVELGDFTAALSDLERVVKADPGYDFHRAKGLLAHAYANTGLPAKADVAFQEATKISTLSETYYNYATFLAAQQRNARRASGHRKFSAKKPPCPATFAGASAPGFGKPAASSSGFPAAERC